MPVRVRKMCAAIPLAATLAILLSAVVAGFIHTRNCLTWLFFGLYGCCLHVILHGTSVGAAGKGHSAGAFHYANFVHAATDNIHPPIGGCRHMTRRTAFRGERRAGFTLSRSRLELETRVRSRSPMGQPRYSHHDRLARPILQCGCL
jgi:hypothetical protein